MEAFLKGFLPRFFQDENRYEIIPHPGKSALRKSLPRKLRAWDHSLVERFIVLHDQDANDCMNLKRDLLELCRHSRHPESIVRIVCRELESWYLGNLTATMKILGIKKALHKVPRKIATHPDSDLKPSIRLKRLLPNYSKIASSRVLGPTLPLENNNSRSFNLFVDTLRTFD